MRTEGVVTIYMFKEKDNHLDCLRRRTQLRTFKLDLRNLELEKKPSGLWK